MNQAQARRKDELETAIRITTQELSAMDDRVFFGGGMGDMHEFSTTYAAYERDLAWFKQQLDDLQSCNEVGCEPDELDPGVYFCLRCGATWINEERS